MNTTESRPRLVLASASAARRALLKRLGMPFEIDPAEIDEAPNPQEAPDALAVRLAREKALVVAKRHPDALIIGSDQVADLNGMRLGKPGGFEHAKSQLARCSGRSVTFWTAFCVIDTRNDNERAHLDDTLVHFRTLADDEIERYLSREEPYSCAGSFKAESLGIALFEKIDAVDPTALIGLPLISLSAALSSLGLPVI